MTTFTIEPPANPERVRCYYPITVTKSPYENYWRPCGGTAVGHIGSAFPENFRCEEHAPSDPNVRVVLGPSLTRPRPRPVPMGRFVV